jgi:hypothetical protein
MGGKVTKNSKIVLKDFHEHINVFMKSFGDYPLIIWSSIFNPKRHYTHPKAPQSVTKVGLVLVLQCFGNLVVFRKTI